MSSSPYTLNEPPDVIMDEVTWLQGAFISSLLCGVQITLSVMSFCAVLKQRMPRRPRIALLVYIFLLCAVMTAGQQISLLFIQTGFIEQRDYPGGPSAFLSSQYATPVPFASTSLFVVGNWMMESLLVSLGAWMFDEVWRCKVVCVAGEQPMWCGVVFPSVLLTAEYGAPWPSSWSQGTYLPLVVFPRVATVTGILFLHKLLQGGYTIHYAVAYLGLSLLLSVSVTAIIAGRLLLHRRWMVKQFGRGYGTYYVGVAAVLIESASFYTGFLILVIIFFNVGTSTSNILQQAVVHVEGITSMLIIYRITQGEGWSDDNGVSSMDWKGSTDEQMMREAVHAEGRSNPAQVVVPVSTILSKEEGTTTVKGTSSTDNTLARDDVV